MTKFEKIAIQGFLDDFKEIYEKAIKNVENPFYPTPFVATAVWVNLDNIKICLEKWGFKLNPIF